MAHRAVDGEPVKITREIPLWGLLCSLGAFAFQAILLWSGSHEQVTQIQALTVEIHELRSAVTAGSLKTVEHDVKLTDHERRIQQLENRRGP